MTLAIAVEKEKGEKTRLFLLEQGLLDNSLQLKKTKNRLVLLLKKPLSRKQKTHVGKRIGSFEVTGASFKETDLKPRSLEEALKGILSKKELSELITSFDIIGEIALILIPDELVEKEKVIGKALLKANPQVSTVARILGGHDGKFRTRPVKVIAGEKKLNALHREWNCRFKVKLGEVFFSPRLSFERARIARKIKKGERVSVFFAGVGPFAIIFAKHSKAKKVYAVELNPKAFSLMKENIELNKCGGKVKAFEGDVKKIVPEHLKEKCDRIVMPLPKGGEHFLDSAFLALKPRGGIIHFYQFVEKTDLYTQPIKLLKKTAKEFGYRIKVKNKKVVRSFSPARVQVVVDALVRRG